MKPVVYALAGAILFGSTADSLGGTVDVSTLKLMATIQTRGQYDNAGLSYWNGAPLSPSNQPTYSEDQLSATLSFYVDPKQRNDLFITVSNVYDTQFGYISGPPFDYVALTGLDLSVRLRGHTSSLAAVFSNQWALPGEELLNGGVGGANVPLSSTPGWTLVSATRNGKTWDYSMDSSSVNYGLTHFSDVWGETRIYGGAAFSLQFGENIDLFRDLDFTDLTANTEFGFGRYSATDVTAVPEPSTWLMTLLGTVSLSLVTFLRSRKPWGGSLA
jgi:hypothetical protein